MKSAGLINATARGKIRQEDHVYVDRGSMEMWNMEMSGEMGKKLFKSGKFIFSQAKMVKF